MRVFLQLLGVVFFFLFDPFGLKSATNEQSISAYTQLAAPWYAGSRAGRVLPNIGQDQISVVMMTDKAAELLAGAYPVPLHVHGRAISKILCAGAKTVFIDINFRWERIEGDVKELISYLQMRPKDGGCFETTAKERAETEAAPVIIGHILSTTSECDPLGENDQPDCARIDPGYREIRRLRDIAKIITLPEPESDLEYIVAEKIGQIEKTSPAYELLDVLCKSGPGALSVCRDREAFLNRTIVLDWGQLVSRRDSPMKRWLGGKCSPRQYLGGTGDPISKMWLTLRIFIEAFPYLRPDDAGQCPFHDTMVANDVIDAANLGDSKSEGGWTGNEILRSMFKDRVVLYGLQIAGVGDYVRSPTLGRVAGTYAHAMALDNLITRGPSTWVSPDPLVSKGHWTWALVIETLLAIALILAGWRIEERNDREFARVVLEQGRRDADAKAAYELHRVFKWTFLFAAALAVAAVVLAEQHIFNWPPGDWIALLAVAIVGKPNHRKYEEWMGGRTRPG